MENNRCKYCREFVSINAKKCPHCRSIIYNRPFMVFIINLILPGLGYLAKEKFAKAIVACVLVSLGYTMLIVPGLIIHLLILLDSLIFE